MPEAEKRPYIGGQAVLEGVMMRSPRSFAVVVRRRAGELVVRERPMSDSRRGLVSWPFMRGVTSLVEAIKLGSEALRFSSDVYESDLEAIERTPRADVPPPSQSPLAGVILMCATGLLAVAMHEAGEPEPAALAAPPSAAASAGSAGSRGARIASVVLAVVLSLFLYVALPQGAAALASRAGGLDLDIRSTLFQVLTGGFKLLVIVGNLLLLRRIPELRRVFQYHGAEHKTISTYEAGEALVVENARAKTTLHPRCGTTFIVMLALVSVFLFSAIGTFLPHFGLGKIADNVVFFLVKLPFLPLLAAVTFELQRLFARHFTTGPLRALLVPGFLVQRITTIEPDDTQLEVALASLRATLWREHAAVGLSGTPSSLVERTFANFGALAADPGYVSMPARAAEAATATSAAALS